jgi:hypothetical protein
MGEQSKLTNAAISQLNRDSEMHRQISIEYIALNLAVIADELTSVRKVLEYEVEQTKKTNERASTKRRH